MSILPPSRPSARPVTRRSSSLQRRRAALASYFAGEDRQRFLVNVLFTGLIGVLLLILVGAVALAWYEQNVRPLAHVGDVEISPGTARAYVAYRGALIQRQIGHVRQAQISGDIDETTAAGLASELNEQAQALATTGLESLIDAIYESQLAADRAITVSDADVDAEMARLLGAPERAHVLAIFVEPQAADEETGPTTAERQAALARAEQAKADLDAGDDWADVASEYSTDDSAGSGGDYGEVSALGGVDQAWTDALFELPEGGTTDIIRGSDGVYRIGRIVTILPNTEEPGARDRMFESVSETQVREFLAYEIADRQLSRQVVAEALAGTPEQVHAAAIFIDGLFAGDEETVDQGEISYSELVFAPNGDLLAGPDTPLDDPAWAEAKAGADAAFEQLSAIEDPDERATKFAELALTDSDGPSAEDGGRQDFTTRGLLPDAIGDALFEGTHEQNELIGPVQADAAWYVLLFDERRQSPEQKVNEVVEKLQQPGADFAELAREYSDGPEAEDGGEIGWLTRETLNADIVDPLFALQPGDISDPIELGNGHYIFKVDDRGERPLDADQISLVRGSAFETWYAPQKAEAEASGWIVRAGEESPTDFDDEIDFGDELDFGDDEVDFGDEGP